jgi:hypothetical protein
MPNLNDNKDYAELLTAYNNLLDAQKKQEAAQSLQNSGLNALANGALHSNTVKLRELQPAYKRLLEWLSLPENKDAKAEYLGLEISTGLNHFFSA